MYHIIHLHPHSLSKQFCSNSLELEHLLQKATHVVYHCFTYQFTAQQMTPYTHGRLNIPVETQISLLEQLLVKHPHIEFILGFETLWTVANESGWQHLLQDGAAFAVFCRQLYRFCSQGRWSGYCLPIWSSRSSCPLALTQTLPFWRQFSREYTCFLMLPQRYNEQIQWNDYECQLISQNVDGILIPTYGHRPNQQAVHIWSQWAFAHPCLDKEKMVLVMDAMNLVYDHTTQRARDFVPRKQCMKADGCAIQFEGETKISIERKKQMVYVYHLLGLALEDPLMDVSSSSPSSIWSMLTSSLA